MVLKKILLFLLSSFLIVLTFIEARESGVTRFTLDRQGSTSQIVYYYEAPQIKEDKYPIILLCDGAPEYPLRSVLFFNKCFGPYAYDLGLGCLSVESWGIDGKIIDKKEFWDHYTRSQRLEDHLAVVNYLEKNPPEGWNGQWIFCGYDEGGRLATDLALVSLNTVAVINLMGAYHSYSERNWDRCRHIAFYYSNWFLDLATNWIFRSTYIPRTRFMFNAFLKEMKEDPSPKKQWGGNLTYLYHADALQQPGIDYEKIQFPYLVLTQGWDFRFSQSEAFVKAAREAGVDVTFICDKNTTERVEGKGELNLIEESFFWLFDVLSNK